MHITRHVMPKGANLASFRCIEKGMKEMYYDEINEIASNPTLNIKPVGYIFYQPGDLHDTNLLKKVLRSLFVRIGDLHHLENPLIKSIEFIEGVSSISESIYLNTNPSLQPFFKQLFPICKSMPISEITIEEDILIEAKLIYKSCLSTEKRNYIAYIGPTNSPYHPRRSYWVNALLKDTSDSTQLKIIPKMDPKMWLNTCIQYEAILSPSLNSQWSHNLFIPNLVGTRIITDCQSLPTYSYYNKARTTALSSCSYSLTLATLKHTITTGKFRNSDTRHEIAINAIGNLEPANLTRQRIYKPHDLRSAYKWRKLSEEDPDQFFRLATAANIFEILQEITRVMVGFDLFMAYFNCNEMYAELSTFFHHPRILYKQKSRLSPTHEGCVIITVEGNSIKGEISAFIVAIHVDMNGLYGKTPRLSSRSFDPQRIVAYEAVQRKLFSVVGANYKSATFSQRLLNSVEVKY